MTDKFYIITHNDLDGVSCLLLYKWLNPSSTFFYSCVSNLNVSEEIEKIVTNSINPKNIIVTDLSLRREFLKFDYPFITFIDHHERSLPWSSQFKNASILNQNFSSNTKLIYDLNKDSAKNILTTNQKKYVLYVDDYDSSTNQFQESYDLNILFWEKYKNDIPQFLIDFNEGFNGFTKSESNIIKNVKINAIHAAKKLNYFSGKINFDETEINAMATFGDHMNSIVIDMIIKKYNPDLFFFINLKTKKVFIRQPNKENVINLSKFAQHYCEGNGNQFSAGGNLTEIFMELTKNLKPL